MKVKNKIGIVAYGASIPQLAISVEAIEEAQGKEVGRVAKALGVAQKTVPAIDEDTVTLSVEAGLQAVNRLQQVTGVSKAEDFPFGSLYIGSESHPYAVKPSGTVVAEALGLPRGMALADLQFACKAGTQALQICGAYVQAGMNQLGLAIGADTAQAAPGDALEFTAGAGAAAFVVGSQTEEKQKEQAPLLAKLLATVSYVSDTPDFWRRPKEEYPQHGGRFTGEPAYFAHVEAATKLLFKETGLTSQQIDYCVFHTPNAKFPKAMAKRLGFSKEQLQHSLVVEKIGNTYAAASMVALANVLDTVEAKKKILVTSYGSGAGADSFLFETTQALVEQRKEWQQLLQEQIARLELVSYREYRKNIERGH